MNQPLKMHKFTTPYNGATAFVLAATEHDARKILLPKCAKIEHDSIVYNGAKELHDLKTPCVMMNEILPF